MLIWGISYVLLAEMGINNQSFLVLVIYPFMYLIGKYLRNTETDKCLINVLYIISVGLSLLYIISILKSIGIDGFYQEYRNIDIISHTENTDRAATGIYSNIMPLSIFIVVVFLDIDSKEKLIYVCSALIAIVCALRLQSRTFLFIISFALIIPLLVNYKSIMKHNKCLLFIGLILTLGVAIYVYQNYATELRVIDRMQTEKVEDGGGRGELAMDVIEALKEKPMGGLTNMRYAHNLWLDCARVAGIIPMVILLVITYKFILSVFRIFRDSKLDFNYRYIVLTLSMSLIVYFNVEPILEGSSLLFAYF